MSHTLITVTILSVFLSRPSSLWCEHPKLAHKRHASMNKATHHSRRIATKIGRKKTRPALDLLTTLAPNAAVCPSPLATRHADSPHSDAEARLWSLSRVPSRFPAARGEKRGGAAMADDEQAERKEEVPEVRPSLSLSSAQRIQLGPNRFGSGCE